MDGDCGDIEKNAYGEFGKNATQIMIFLPHYMWAENYKTLKIGVMG